jgi:hypothetical protein
LGILDFRRSQKDLMSAFLGWVLVSPFQISQSTWRMKGRSRQPAHCESSRARKASALKVGEPG